MIIITSCAEFDSIISFDKKNPNENNQVALESSLRRYPEDNSLHLPPLVEFIVDYNNTHSLRYANHIKKVCDYTKIPFETLNVKNWNANLTVSPSTRVLIIFDTQKLNNSSVNKLIEFTSAGGTLILPFVNSDKRFAYLVGFIPEATFDTDEISKGYRFKIPLLAGMKGKTIQEEVILYGMHAQNFKPDIKILATAANNPEYPAITENTIGQGKVIYFNTSDLFQKHDRGLLFATILKGLESVPYPIANSSTLFLDDFPSPVYNSKIEPIKSEMNLSIADFVQKVWWPDMVELAKKHNISYCAVPAFDYNVKTEPPFLFEQWDALKIKENNKVEHLSSWLMRDCLKNNHELGFHGYNHVSLIKRDWSNAEFIVTSLEGVQKKWKVNNFGNFPVSYVPPSNVIDGMGLKYLKQGMPTLKYMCSLYLGDLEEGGAREFDFDPFHPNFFDYPRISSGFYFGETEQYFLHSLYLYTGIWNHFVHPDDVFQIPSPFNKSAGNYDLRNSKELGWRKTKGKNFGMLSEFDSFLKEMKNLYPQIRFLNAEQGGDATLDWRANQFRHREDPESYTVEKINTEKSITEKQYWLLYGTAENTFDIENQLNNIGASFNKTPFLEGFLFSIYTTKSRLKLKNLKVKSSKTDVSNAKNNYYSFQALQKDYERGEVWVDKYEENLRLEIEALKTKMISDENIDYATWNQYATYMSWTDKGESVWKMLEDHCIKYPQKANIMYSKELEKIVGYPNDLVMEKWYSAQLLVTPNNVDLLNSYVANFYTSENQEKIKKALIALLSVDTSSTSLFNFIQHLLWYEPDNALKEIEKIEPSEDFRPLATNITWLYANDKNLQKAYDWSMYSDEIDIQTKLYWLFELQQYDVLIDEYTRHISTHPDDYKTKAAMAGLYHGIGNFKEAWILADSLPESREKEALRKDLNRDVVYVNDLLKQFLLEYHSGFFLSNVKNNLSKENRLKFGDFIETENEIQTNRDRKAGLKTVHSYNWFDKSKNLHRIAATYSEFYPINRDVNELDPISPENNEDNQFLRVYGMEYRYKNPFSFDKLQYWGRFRTEFTSDNEFFIQAGLGASITKNKNFSSAQMNLFPAETAPGYAKEIYQLKTNLYHSRYFLKKLNFTFSLESNYYTKSRKNEDFETENSIEGIATMRINWENGEPKKMKFIPFLETSASKGTIDLPGGYPYWMLEDRLFGGGGLQWKLGLDEDNLKINLEAGYFVDTFSDEFQRITGSVSYRVFNYWQINGSIELFNQDKFYSNTFNFGLKYNFRERKDFKK